MAYRVCYHNTTLQLQYYIELELREELFLAHHINSAWFIDNRMTCFPIFTFG